jgi:mannose-6-phosphate isomerase-like protein (cupin superfamily)
MGSAGSWQEWRNKAIAPYGRGRRFRRTTLEKENSRMPLSEDIRRVVTTVDEDGKAVVLFDGANPHKVVRPNRSVTSRLLWVTDQTPADISGTADRAATDIGIAPPKHGSIFRVIDIPPTPPEIETLERDYLHKQIGNHAPRKGLPPRHPLMHRTLTIDYAIIMQGEIDMLLDDSEVHLKAGDVLIQQGTNHAWVNRGTEPCRIAFILIDSKEP